jgi:hypothetical protein
LVRLIVRREPLSSRTSTTTRTARRDAAAAYLARNHRVRARLPRLLAYALRHGYVEDPFSPAARADFSARMDVFELAAAEGAEVVAVYTPEWAFGGQTERRGHVYRAPNADGEPGRGRVYWKSDRSLVITTRYSRIYVGGVLLYGQEVAA